MSGELAKRGNYDIAALNNLAADLGSVQQSITASTGAPYLKMGKDGKWGFGQDDTPVEPTSLWAINPMGVSQGAVCWTKYDDTSKTNIKLGEIMVPAGKPKPDLLALPQHEFPWTEQVSFEMACVSGKDKGLQVQYTVGSKGGLNESKKLLATMQQRIVSEQARTNGLDPDKSTIVPIVQLEHSFYNHKNKQFGKIYTPVVTVVRWATLNGTEDPSTAAPAQQAPQAAADVPFEGGAPRTRRRA